MKNLFQKKFPDVCKQVLEFECVLSKRDTEDKVSKFAEIFGQQAIAYTQRGGIVTVYTSQIFTNKLKAMQEGDTVLDSNTGRVGVITSDKPFFCGCSLCFRVDFADSSDVYDCAYFM